MRRILCALFVLCSGVFALGAQAPRSTGTVSGTVADPTGAVIPGATIHIESRKSAVAIPNATSDAVGNYSLTLPPGTYDITVVAEGFDPFVSTVTVPRAGVSVHLNAALNIAAENEQVNVFASQNSTSASDNKSALVIGADQLQSMSDDDDTFQQQVQALAGSDPLSPSAVYVDGFSGGSMPPKDSIREIRINQNPFSAQYADLGYNRIEIFTKPGTDRWHAHFNIFANNSPFNAQNPYSAAQPPYYMLSTRDNASGPLGKKTSLFFGVRYNNRQNNSVINAILPGAVYGSTLPYNAVVPSPTISQEDDFRIDRQVTPNNVFTVRYEFDQTRLTNAGLAGSQTPWNGNGPTTAAVSSQVLPSQATNSTSNSQTLQLSDDQTIGKNKDLQTRFQWIRSHTSQVPVSNAAAVAVGGYFSGGGSPLQAASDHVDRTEFQEYFSLEHGKHYFRIGGQYDGYREANFSSAGYNGAYTYSPNSTNTVSALENYQTGTPSQFSVTTGTPSARIFTANFSAYADDEYRVRKDVTLNFGFRAESQTAIPDHFDLAPRIGASWAIGQTDKRQPFVTLRVGFGLFYDRFSGTNLLTAVREQSGTVQQSYVFTLSGATPTTCTISPTPSCGGTATASVPTLYGVAPNFRSEYRVVTGVTVERAVRKWGNVSLTYQHAQGDHQWISRNINAPLPGTYVFGQPNSGVRPLGGTQNIYQFSSDAGSNTNFVNANTQLQITKKIGYWAWTGGRFQNSSTQGVGSFPTNQYHLDDDYGRTDSATFRLFTGAWMNLPYGFNVSPFIAFTSHSPFNITIGNDLNGDTQYNDRPSFATAASPAASVYATRYGTFNANPQPGEKIIPINYADGPRFAYTELYISKSFKFGPALPSPPAPKAQPGKPAPKPEPPQRKYSFNISTEIDNVFNHPNRGQPVGVLTSPEFGQTLSLNSTFIGSPNANRMIYLGSSFTF